MNDKTTVRMVVGLLGLALLAIIVAAVILSLDGKEIPGELWTLGGGALGGLSALLARTNTEPSPADAIELARAAPASRAAKKP